MVTAMRAIVVTPGQAGSGRVQEVPTPEPGPGEVLVEVIEVGVCGTDMEILNGDYGEAPPGDDYLVLGHENFGRVVQAPAGAEVSEGDLVVCVVRRPDPVPCASCAAGEFDMCHNGLYTERGIKGRHGFMSEYYTETPAYLVKLPPQLESIGVLIEPLTVVEKGIQQAIEIQRRLVWELEEAVVTGAGPIGLMATFLLRSMGIKVWTVDIVERTSNRAKMVEACGATYVKGDETSLLDLSTQLGDHIDLIVEATAVPQIVFEAMDAVGANGVVCLTGVSAGSRKLEVAGAHLNFEMVLMNKVVFGSVNANKRYYASAVQDLAKFEELWPGLCAQVITRRVPADTFQEALTPRAGIDVKSTVSIRS
jgi:threonine dehydrogenase-like Zn-dependent dehydrogenase